MVSAALSTCMIRTHHPLLAWLAPALATEPTDVVAATDDHVPDTAEWRDYLRLFATAWAAGFLFFLVWIG